MIDYNCTSAARVCHWVLTIKKKNIDHRKYLKLTLKCPSFQNIAFRFEGYVGKTSSSDIAIDDVAILPGRCGKCENFINQNQF